MKYFPILFHTLIIFSTLLYSFWGPMEYHNYNKSVVSLFIVGYLIVINSGFYLGVNSKRVVNNTGIRYNRIMIDIYHFFAIFSVLLYLLYFLYLFNIGRINFSILSMGKAYVEYYKEYGTKTSLISIELIFILLVAIPKYIAINLGFFYYNDLSKRFKRQLFLLLILIFITQTLSAGNQKAVGDIVIFLFFFLIYKASKMDITQRKKIIKRSLAIVSVMVILFSYSQYDRVATRNISVKNINNEINSKIYKYDFNHPVFKIFGEKMGLGISIFTTNYLSSGYYGLSKSMELPFEWTYGIGNSVTLSSVTKAITGIDVYKSTYLNRMEKEFGIMGKRKWHTIFPWLASDFTFVGTIFIFFFIALTYGIAWKEVIVYNNPVSYLMFILLSVMFTFVISNNQIFHGFDYFETSTAIIVFWLFTHSKFNKINEGSN
ncbi:MAG: hypothetical protein ABFS35_07720 [Bacteroidota bacterium]